MDQLLPYWAPSIRNSYRTGYFPSSDIFVSLFSEPSGEENNNKISERGKYIHIVRVTCDNYFIISTKNI